MKAYLGALAVIVAASATCAGDADRLFFGIGYDDLKGYRESAPVVSIDYDFRQFSRSDRFRWRVAAMAMTDSDFWVGAGFSYTRPMDSGRWYFEASLLPGLYYYGETDYPGRNHVNFPMFRTQGGFGRYMKNGSSLAVVLSHISAANVNQKSGSTESLMLRYGTSF